MSTQALDSNLDKVPAVTLENIVLGGGCFWCVEAVLQSVEGVLSVVSGYAGGTEKDANYTAVCSGLTDHVEVAEVTFNPTVISLDQILLMFWSSHDPTTPNRQGNDVGPQYRSAIFYNNEPQKALAEASKKEVATSIWDKPIVTEIRPLEKFFPAEDYHQNYYNNVGNRNSYCTFVITPKVTKFRKQFADKLKKA
jgi:methionine-S-sulfoxide reductase